MLITIPLSKSNQIAIIALVAILLVSAAALRLTPSEDSDSSNASTSPDLECIISEAEETEEFLKVMYIGSVDARNNTIRAMHGKVEAQENLRQICIR